MNDNPSPVDLSPGSPSVEIARALRTGDRERVLALCFEHPATIADAFPMLAKLPPDLHDDAAGTDTWMHAVVLCAHTLKSLGYDDPLDSLFSRGNNPITMWKESLRSALEMSNAGLFEESDAVLLKLVEQLEGSRGTAVADVLPKALGLLGTNRMNARDVAGALLWTSRALEACRAAKDYEGVHVYMTNLATIAAVHESQTVGPGSPRLRWRAALVRAQTLADAGRFERSIQGALPLVDELSDAGVQPGPGFEYLLGRACGLLGTNYFAVGDWPRAAASTRRAHEEFERLSDGYAAAVYAANLAHIQKAASKAEQGNCGA